MYFDDNCYLFICYGVHRSSAILSVLGVLPSENPIFYKPFYDWIYGENDLWKVGVNSRVKKGSQSEKLQHSQNERRVKFAQMVQFYCPILYIFICVELASFAC